MKPIKFKLDENHEVVVDNDELIEELQDNGKRIRPQGPGIGRIVLAIVATLLFFGSCVYFKGPGSKSRVTVRKGDCKNVDTEGAATEFGLKLPPGEYRVCKFEGRDEE